MPEIRPFRAWRYHSAKVKNLARVVAPPYDVISKQEQSRLYDASPYNVIRMELGRDLPGDSAKENRYTRAGRFLMDWKSEGVLARERQNAFYVYVQNYEEEGKKKTRTGFFAAMKLDPKAVLKHENTLTGPKKDRLRLLKAVRTNLSPIFGLIEDASGSVQKILKSSSRTAPALDVKVDGVRHRLFVERRPRALKKIVSLMRSKPMFIADGHHRFEVACQFKKWMSATERRRIRPKAKTDSPALYGESAQDGGDAPWNYALTYFSDCRHNPFKIFPTHRLLKVSGNRSLAEILKGRGILRPCREHACVFPARSYQFGFYSKKEGFRTFTLLSKAVLGIDKKNPLDRLDVTVLHKRIIGPLFGIHEIEKSDAIDFTRDAGQAIGKVKKGEWDLAIFLRPTSLEDMLQASKKGLKMPQKSTYFHPKLLTGLVFYGFDGGQ